VVHWSSDSGSAGRRRKAVSAVRPILWGPVSKVDGIELHDTAFLIEGNAARGRSLESTPARSYRWQRIWPGVSNSAPRSERMAAVENHPLK
jgi:hypothetical protein